MRFTLLPLFVAVAMIAAVFAGMTYRTEVWTAAVVSMTIGLLAWMAVRAIALTGESRAFAMAFAVLGTSYLLLATCSPTRVQAYLLTNYPIAWGARHADVFPEPSLGGGGFFSVADSLLVAESLPAQVSLGEDDEEIESGSSNLLPLQQIIDISVSDAPVGLEVHRYFVMGHCLFTGCFGLIAGYSAGYLYRRANPTSATVPEDR